VPSAAHGRATILGRGTASSPASAAHSSWRSSSVNVDQHYFIVDHDTFVTTGSSSTDISYNHAE